MKTERDIMITNTAHRVIKRIKQGDVKSKEDVRKKVEEIFSSYAYNDHKWAENIKKYSWKHFVDAVIRKIKELAKYE